MRLWTRNNNKIKTKRKNFTERWFLWSFVDRARSWCIKRRPWASSRILLMRRKRIALCQPLLTIYFQIVAWLGSKSPITSNIQYSQLKRRCSVCQSNYLCSLLKSSDKRTRPRVNCAGVCSPRVTTEWGGTG